MRRTLFVVTLIAAFPTFAQSGLSVDWEWKLAHRCNNTSPALTISGIPEGTKTLAVQMNDLDFQNKNHGGGSVPHAEGSTAEIKEGGLATDYLGPCPSNFSSWGHNYQITVRALGVDGVELGKGIKAKEFSAKTAK